MTTMSRATFQSISAAYQKALTRSVLPIIILNPLLMLSIGFAFVRLRDQISPAERLWFLVPLALVGMVGGLFFRRNVGRLSEECKLICPSCNASLGFYYATLKRTGKCGKCGVQVVDAT